MKRTQEQKDKAIEFLFAEKSTLPEYNYFNEPVWKNYDYCIEILKGTITRYDVQKDEEYEDITENLAIKAGDILDWLDGEEIDWFEDL